MGVCCTKKSPRGVIMPDFIHTQISLKKGPLVGKGAYGSVYQSIDTNSGKFYAIKTIDLQGQITQLQKQFIILKQQVEQLRNLSHPNVITYYKVELSIQKANVDIVLQYCPGGSLRDLLNKFGPFQEVLVRTYIKQVLQGLKYLHCKGIIHRDIKCANLLVNQIGAIKVSDFGAAKRTQQCQQGNNGLSASRSLKGSPYWMAPEVANRTGHSFSADIWSVGCVVIEMLTAKPLWADVTRSTREIMQIISNLNEPPKFPEWISGKCKEFLQECFQIEAEKRPTAECLLTHAFVVN